jgi:hypothetical protein
LLLLLLLFLFYVCTASISLFSLKELSSKLRMDRIDNMKGDSFSS